MLVRRWDPRGNRAGERGVAMVEATIGTVLLLLAALIVIQLSLVFHGALAAHGAATRSAREYALTEDMGEVQEVYRLQIGTSLRALRWEPPECRLESTRAFCTAVVRVPVVVPGAGVVGGGGPLSPIPVVEIGTYPRGGV